MALTTLLLADPLPPSNETTLPKLLVIGFVIDRTTPLMSAPQPVFVG